MLKGMDTKSGTREGSLYEKTTNGKQAGQPIGHRVSDYAAGEEKSWEDLRRALRAWVDQGGMPAEEFMLVESSRYKGQIPSDLSGMVPNMKIPYIIDAESSCELKNRARVKR